MESVFNDFQNFREEKRNKIFNSNFNKVFQKFFLYLVPEEEEHSLEEINNKNNQIKIISIDEFSFNDEIYFIICFDQSLIIVQQTRLSKLQTYLSNNSDSSFYFFNKNNTDIKKNFTFEFNVLKNINDDDLDECIYQFTNNTSINSDVTSILQFWDFIHRCLFGFILLKSYQKSNYNRITAHIEKEEIFNKYTFMDADYIYLKLMGIGSASEVDLIFHYESEKLLIRKKMNSKYLFDREISNYVILENEYPYFPKYFVSKNESLFIEFINGQLLSDLISNLTFEEKVKILFEIMISIQYLHNKNFVYRDLKPNNIIIDNNKIAVLIDFDEMISFKEESEHSDGEVHTNNFASKYAADEIKSTNSLSHKTDVFSIGQIMKDLFPDKESTNNNLDNILKEKIKNISSKCTKKEPNDRLSLSELIHLWYTEIYWPHLTKQLFHVEQNENVEDLSETKTIESINDIYKDNKYSNYWICLSEYDNPLCLNKIGNIYFDGNLIPINHMKAFHYYIRSSKHNYSVGQDNVGCMYGNGNYVKKDLSKAIEYLTKAANQNYKKAQYDLSLIYFMEGKFQNIQKAFEYLMLSVKNECLEAINKLGICYLDGKDINRDINKAIDCFKRTAEQNDEFGLYHLGYIYSKKEYNSLNYKLAIDYLLLAAEKNFREAFFVLGLIYHYDLNNINLALKYYTKGAELKCSKSLYNIGLIYSDYTFYSIRDINKSIKYWSEAAELNHLEAQKSLGDLYYKGGEIKINIDKAKYYYKLAANQNDVYSQVVLGEIHLKYFDIKEAIHYFSLAAENNEIIALNNLGKIYIDPNYFNRDINKSIYYYKKASDLGDPKGSFLLGIIYQKYVKNIQEAIHYFTIAANKRYMMAYVGLGSIYYDEGYFNKSFNCYLIAAQYDYGDALFRLGVFYLYGLCVNKDINTAINYLKKAAERGSHEAECNLGNIYEYGYGVPVDIYNAIYYYEKSSDFINLASFQLSNIYLKNKYKNIQKALFYLNKAANQDCSHALYNLGFLYFYGNNVPRNKNKGLKYIEKAAELKESKSLLFLGLYYLEGIHTEINVSKGIDYLIRSSLANNSNAQYFLGKLYFEGVLAPCNYQESLKYLLMSSENDNADAYFLLGIIYQNGKGVQSNINKAIEYYKKASNRNNRFAKVNLAVLMIHDNINYSIELLEEVILETNNSLAMYNLANIYFYNENINFGKYQNNWIDLLIQSANQNIYESKLLLCIVLIKKFNPINQKIIESEILKYEKDSHELSLKLHNIMINNNLIERGKSYIYFYFNLKNNYLRYYKEEIILIGTNLKQQQKDINNNFYDGFGLDLL